MSGMQTFITIFIVSFGIVLSGCAGPSYIKFVPAPLDNQVVKKVEDVTFVSSKGENIDVAAGVHDTLKFDNVLALYVVINNHSESPIDFSTVNIKAIYGHKPIHIYSDIEFAKYLDWQKAKDMRSPSVNVSPVNGKLYALSYLTASLEIAANYEKMRNLILRDKTIRPGESNEGMILVQKIDAARAQMPFVLFFKLGSEIHEIRFSIATRT